MSQEGKETQTISQVVTLPDDITDVIRREAEFQGRSFEAQVMHWLKIGRSIELLETFDYERVRAALAGQLDSTELSEREAAVWVDAGVDLIAEPQDAGECTFNAAFKASRATVSPELDLESHRRDDPEAPVSDAKGLAENDPPLRRE